MTLKLFAAVMLCVTLSVLSQFLLKLGVSSPAFQQRLVGGAGGELVWAALGSGFVVGGIVLYGLAAVFWMLVLAHADLSLVYPFVGLGFVLIMLLGWAVLGEPLNAAKLVGTLLIAVGVVFVARS